MASVRAEARRLDERRSQVAKGRARLLLEAGREPEAVAAAEALVAGEPLREGAWAVLVEGLPRTDRHAGAIPRDPAHRNGARRRRARAVASPAPGRAGGARRRVGRQGPAPLRPAGPSRRAPRSRRWPRHARRPRHRPGGGPRPARHRQRRDAGGPRAASARPAWPSRSPGPPAPRRGMGVRIVELARLDAGEECRLQSWPNSGWRADKRRAPKPSSAPATSTCWWCSTTPSASSARRPTLWTSYVRADRPSGSSPRAARSWASTASAGGPSPRSELGRARRPDAACSSRGPGPRPTISA